MRPSGVRFRIVLGLKEAVLKQSVLKNAPSILPWPISLNIYSSDTSSHDLPSLFAIHGKYKSEILGAITGKYICEPPRLRLVGENVSVDCVSFADFSGLDRSHMSARYETFSHRGTLESESANLVQNYVNGSNNYNQLAPPDPEWVNFLLTAFDLGPLADRWVGALSNGQMRRARLARALVSKPTILVVDDPFLGLDLNAREWVVDSLGKVASASSLSQGTSLVLGVRSLDKVPDWIQKTLCAQESGLIESDTNEEADKTPNVTITPYEHVADDRIPHIEFKNAHVAYKGIPVFKNLNWIAHAGSRWRIHGQNGLGKTTLLALIAAEHPQLWRGFVLVDGVPRRTGSGVSYFEVNNELGVSLPELHALVPRHSRTMRELILNGLVLDVGSSNFTYRFPQEKGLPLSAQKVFEYFALELADHADQQFVNLSVTYQKLCLFLRAIIKSPRMLILDEAFSGMDDPELIAKCHRYVNEEMPKTTVFAIGHIDSEVPPCEYLLQLSGDPDSPLSLFRYQK